MTISTDPTATLVVIVGITGKQGGSVARALIESDKPYRIRGLTRDTSKPAAQAFAQAGAEMVAVSLTVGNEVGVRAAFQDADIVFAVTNFLEHLDKEREIVEGKMMVDVAKAVGVKLFIWSALESFSDLSAGRLTNVAFFDSKAIITAYAKASGIPLAIVQAGYYMTNVLEAASYALKKMPDGNFTWNLPMAGTTRVPLIDAEADYGLYVRAAIENSTLGTDSEVLSGRLISMEDIIAQLAEATGKQIVYSECSPAEFADVFPFKMLVPAFVDMCQAYEKIGYYGPKAPSGEHILARPIRSWRQYVEAIPEAVFPAEIRPA